MHFFIRAIIYLMDEFCFEPLYIILIWFLLLKILDILKKLKYNTY